MPIPSPATTGLTRRPLETAYAVMMTGSDTSVAACCAATVLRTFEEAGRQRVEFKMHPNQRDTETVVVCVADVIDERVVRDSGGHREERFVIETPVRIGEWEWPIEVTLTARDDMLFRMLLGRTAMKGRAIVDPSKSYLTGGQHLPNPEASP